MCGLAGIFSSNSLSPEEINASCLFSSRQSHRGPDSSDFKIYANSRLVLHHQRLSILDLSLDSNQPKSSICGRYHFCFNGEIYNFKELADELLGYYVPSDTLCLSHLLSSYPLLSLLNKFDGMFSLAVYDSEEDKIFLARDSSGQKPLFYSYINNRLVFSSELSFIASFLKFSGVSCGIDSKTAISYAAFGYCTHNRTIYNEISSLQPGYLLTLNFSEQLDIVPWHFSQINSDYSEYLNQLSLNEKNELFRNTLVKSVELSLRSDVPCSFFLSGGVDSSVLCTIASRELGLQFSAFTYDDPLDNSTELASACLTADQLNINHNIYQPKLSDISESIDFLLTNLDSPPVDSSFVPTYLICKQASSSFKVILGGDGADEFQYGYQRYHSDLLKYRNLFPYFNFFPPTNISNLFQRHLCPGSHSEKIIKLFLIIFSSNALYSYLIKNSFLFAYDSILDLHKISSDLHDLSMPQVYANFDQLYYLPEDILVKADRASMLSSIELRSPFLNNDIRRLSSFMPPNFFGTLKKPSLQILDYYKVNYNKDKKTGFTASVEENFLRINLTHVKSTVYYFWGHLISSTCLDFLFNRFEQGRSTNELLWRMYSVAEWSIRRSLA